MSITERIFIYATFGFTFAALFFVYKSIGHLLSCIKSQDEIIEILRKHIFGDKK